MDVALHQGYSHYLPHYQLEALKQQNAKYKEELSLSRERSNSENQHIGALCKEMHEEKVLNAQRSPVLMEHF
ncbi:hypothetical protein WMY93_020819 [Mugilogobius chulae]|uniref:Uncharacterized protein n=1 Tax=Mugilogobius chulae TaxID=88201 RepID=A0AAW0NK34_9GOBI